MGLLIHRPRSHPTTEQTTSAGSSDGETAVNENVRNPDAEPRMNHRLFNGRRSGHPHFNLSVDHDTSLSSSDTDLENTTHSGMTRSRSIGFLQSDRESRIRTLYHEKEHLLHRLSLTNAELEQLLGTTHRADFATVETDSEISRDISRIDLPNTLTFRSNRRYVQAPLHRISPLWNEQAEFQLDARNTFQSIAQGRRTSIPTPLTLSEVSASILSAANRSPNHAARLMHELL